MKKIGLLPRIIVAIILGLLLGTVLPSGLIKVFITFNGLFSQFLGFSIPLIIIGFIVPSIADLGKDAKRLLLITLIFAYGSTLFAGFFSYFTANTIFPNLVEYNPASIQSHDPEAGLLGPLFSLPIPPAFSVTTALILAFVLGIGIAAIKGNALRQVFVDFREVIEKLIAYAIVPLLPVYIFGIFLNMRHSGAAFQVIGLFGKVILVIFAVHVIVMLIEFTVAGIASKQNPLKMLGLMMPAYMTALGTSSSAATIPVTLAQTKKLGVSEDIADFTIPLCATCHMTGSVLKIVAMSMAICIMQGIPYDILTYTGFILMLSVMMVAAPGVPGGAIMAAVGVLQTVLGFDENAVGLMIALYIAIDSFGTACNVTNDGAISVLVQKLEAKLGKRA
ncbi:MAG: dicarboxylate/amino acid:cation symporter [Deferribacteraceae bacterium]|jgi:Na+/H+-dicarboxylate symporter|nr:dicarboxylate/amino acid:cation symporter [Deferribacteraceae bacterium]